MARESREVWEKRVRRLHESELRDAEFAAEIGVNLHTLRSWKWKLKGEAKAASRSGNEVSARRGKRRDDGKPQRTTFVEVAPAVPTVSIELRVAGVEVRVPAGFDEPTLSRVLAVLRQSA